MMYEDTLEKPKNSILRAMKRRGQKNVAFTDPTYRDPPVYDFSSSEEEDEEDSEGAEMHEEQNHSAMDVSDDEDDIAAEPASARAQANQLEISDPDDEEKRGGLENPSNDDMERRKYHLQAQVDIANFAVDPRVTRNGTIRNTDSFFKDDNTETRKISLTPNLLRDDSAPKADIFRERSSFESDKTDRSKEEKKKEKKGVLSIFKRNKKDKKKPAEVDSISSAKSSTEYSRDSPVLSKTNSSAKSSNEISRDVAVTNSNNEVQRMGSNKLTKQVQQKQQKPIVSPNGLRPLHLGQDQNSQLNGDIRDVSSDKRNINDGSVRSLGLDSKPGPLQIVKQTSYSEYDSAHERLSDSPVHVSPSEAQPDSEPPALVRDSSSDSDGVRSLRDSPSPQISSPRLANGGLLLTTGHANGLASGSTDISPISPSARGLGVPSPQMHQGSFPAHPTRAAPSQPPALFSYHQGHHAGGKLETSSSSPADRAGSISTLSNSVSTATTIPSPSTIIWSDASLRAYFDDPIPGPGTSSASGSPQVGILTPSGMGCAAHDVRDLILLTRDTTGVVPVGPDHPLMKGLFVEERAKTKEVGDLLDGLLGNWLERRLARQHTQMQYGAK
jgi:hypothetical protein